MERYTGTAYVSVVTRRTANTNTSESLDPERLGVACVGVMKNGDFYFFEEENLDDLLSILKESERVVGVSDFVVDALKAYDGTEKIEFVGVLDAVNRHLGDGKRVSFNNVTKNSLGKERPDMRSLPLDWESGRKESVRHGLRKDLRLLKEIDEKIHVDGRVTVRDPDTFEERAVDVV
ncbi:MAG: hypothetical protein SV253_01135 [Halobacteria archaeon]|nr:hypothetical protein [Halobacteria archaeon]